MNRTRDPGLIGAVLAAALALAASLFFAFAPTTSTSTSRSVFVSPSGEPTPTAPVVHRTTSTLLESEGAGAVPVLAIPVALAAGAIAVSRLGSRRPIRLVLASLLLAGCVAGAASVGLFYVPAAVALVWGALATPPSLRLAEARA